MFQNCSSLITVPELPATTLSRNCYTSMFNGCSSITTAPELPATELTNYCYQKMFANCTSLTTVPELPATILATSCYQEMFLNCTSLKNLTIYYKGDNLANNAFDMLANVSEDGNFYMLEDATFDTEDVVPTNWIINKINTEPKMYFFIENISGAINTVSITKSNASAPTLNLEYSYDTLTWNNITMNEDTTPNNLEIPVDGKIYLRGVNNTWGSSVNYNHYNVITATGNHNVGGNIMSLLYGSEFENKTTSLSGTYVLSSLFRGNTNLVNAQDLQLPATKLSTACYRELFSDCTNLTTVPELPATTLSKDCYFKMFSGTNLLPDCSNIDFTSETVVKSGGLSGLFAGTKVTDEDLMELLPINPETGHYYLPVMNLGNSCYYYMFQGCISLTTAPELPATTLAYGCYSAMFLSCSSLTTAPALPATTLADNCYQHMFKDCKSLTIAPDLPATTLTKYCYYSMFNGCSSLTTAPDLPAITLFSLCYAEMFQNCNNLTTAPELPATTLAYGCYSYMFQGCISLTTAPSILPATTLADNCYQQMFYGCTSLTTAPELPATTLASSCYYCMFWNCTSLTTAPELPATTLAQSCYAGMFNSCTSLTTAPELPATTLAANCYTSMFNNCTNLTTVPELSATTLGAYCYNRMFYCCYKLNYIKADFINYSNDNNEFTEWVYGVSKTGTFVMNPEATYNVDEIRGANGIPKNWNAKRAGIDTLMIIAID